MALWGLRLGANCRYRDALTNVVMYDRPQSTRALLERGAQVCAAAAVAAAAASAGEGRRRSLWRRAAAALARLRLRAQGRCPRGGDHRVAGREAFRLAINCASSRKTILCFPKHLWDLREVRERTVKGWTPLDVALFGGYLEVAEHLLRRGEATAIVTEGIQPIYYAVENYAAQDDDTVLQWLRLFLQYGSSLNCADGEENPLVCRAASVSSVKILEFFFEHGVKTDTCDNSGQNLLHYATKADIVDFLLARGVDPNAADVDGRLPVHSAAVNGHVGALGALLPHTQENAHDCNGNSPLHLAAQEGQARAVELLARGALALEDSVDCTVRAPSLQSEDGIPREEHGPNGSSRRQMAVHQSKYDVNAKNSDGCTALHLAVRNGRLDVSEVLLRCGADPQAVDNHLHTPFDYVISSRRQWAKVEILLKLFVDAGLNLSHQDEKGRTALHKAVVLGKNEIVRFLLLSGARVDLKDASGLTALDLAQGHADRKKILFMLKKRLESS